MLKDPRLMSVLGVAVLVAMGIVLWVWEPWNGNAAPLPDKVGFDKDRAMRYLKQICDIGPRISGSEGMAKQQELLTKHFEKHGAKVRLQKFEAQQRSQKKPVPMANLIASWHPERTRRLILCAHYDTRPIADQEFDERDWTKPFVSANDGGSGVALMMELAHHMAKLDLKLGVDFVCFDGEEYIFNNRPDDAGGDFYFFGSDHFAAEYQKARQQDAKSPVYVEAVLMDMIAGKKPEFYYEDYSFVQAGRLAEKIWKIAGEFQYKNWTPKVKHAVRDDHLALLRAGIPAIDIIDFDYPHWHRLSDTPENCSAEGLMQVAQVVAVWMERAR
jgi:hypothetical protein